MPTINELPKIKKWDKVECLNEEKWIIKTWTQWTVVRVWSSWRGCDVNFPNYQEFQMFSDEVKVISRFTTTKTITTKPRYTYEKKYTRNDWIVFEKDKINIDWYNIRTIKEIEQDIVNKSGEINKLRWLLNSYKNLKF